MLKLIAFVFCISSLVGSEAMSSGSIILGEMKDDFVKISAITKTEISKYNLDTFITKPVSAGTLIKMADVVLHGRPKSIEELSFGTSLLCRSIQIECIPEVCFSLYNYHNFTNFIKDIGLFGDKDVAFEHVGTVLLALACHFNPSFIKIIDTDERDLYDKEGVHTFLKILNFPSTNCFSWAVKISLEHSDVFTF